MIYHITLVYFLGSLEQADLRETRKTKYRRGIKWKTMYPLIALGRLSVARGRIPLVNLGEHGPHSLPVSNLKINFLTNF